jgi:dinuclear metal center YbgI/SA1388 family protein
MLVKRDDIVRYCEEYLKVKDFKDYCHNGLQVEGKDRISKIVTGVSLSQKLIEAAIEKKADMLMVHHGIFGDLIGTPPVIRGVIRNRLKLLLERDINLCGFHLPLDAHSEIGNNASLSSLLELKNLQPVGIGFIGILDVAVNRDEFILRVNEKIGTNSYVIPAGSDQVCKVGIISGGASPDYELMAQAGADTFIAGDVRESIVRGVEEVGINFINAGHYNTEKLGIHNLGELLAKKFKLEAEFVDVPCDI